MQEGGYCNSKKTNDICTYICGPASQAALRMSRLRCIFRGFDHKALLLLFVGLPLFIFGIYLHGQKITYFLRPLWGSPPKPFNIIPHYYHENVSMENQCKLHSWGIRETQRRVFDAVLFSNLVDNLEIRWVELHLFVSEFVLLESNSTFTGQVKPLFFAQNRDRFKFVESRLTYSIVGGLTQHGTSSNWPYWCCAFKQELCRTREIWFISGDVSLSKGCYWGGSFGRYIKRKDHRK